MAVRTEGWDTQWFVRSGHVVEVEGDGGREKGRNGGRVIPLPQVRG